MSKLQDRIIVGVIAAGFMGSAAMFLLVIVIGWKGARLFFNF